MRKILFIPLFILLYSCSKEKVNVVLDKSKYSDQPEEITIDDSMKFVLKNDTSFPLSLTIGEHILKRGKETKSFKVGEKGGIINLDNTEYVLYELRYATVGNKLDLSGMQILPPFMIDSFIVSKKMGIMGTFLTKTDAELMSSLPEMEKNAPVPIEARTPRFMKIGKDEFYIERFWDYNLGETPPAEVEIETTNTGLGSASRFTVVRAQSFLISILLQGSREYDARSVSSVKAGLYDKRMELEKKQKEQNQQGQ